MKAFKGETDKKGAGRGKSGRKSGNEIRTRAKLIARGRKLHTWKGKKQNKTPSSFKEEKIKLDSHQQLTGDTANGREESQIKNMKVYPHIGRISLKIRNAQNPSALFLADQQIHA